MSDFKKVKQAVEQKFLSLTTQPLFTVNIPERDTLVDIYLNSFDDLTERQYHNCNCCKSFIRQYGNVVAITDGVISSIWDTEVDDSQYQHTLSLLKEYVLTRPVEGIFLTDIQKLGTNYNIAKESLIRWEHFYVELPKALIYRGKIDTKKSEVVATVQVFGRSLKELTIDSCETVLELIAQNSLYRGQEFKQTVELFLKHKKKYASMLSEREKELYVWEHAKENLRIRNTAIGTLLIDLSEGTELDVAVTKFERVVAPSNYKRPTSLVTPRMVEDAKKTVESLGLSSSLKRRYAVSSDIQIEQVLFADRSFKKETTIFDTISKQQLINPKSLTKVEEVTLDTFIKEVLPKVSNVELLVENKHTSRFVTLTAAEDKEAPKLFTWASDLAWSYVGNVTDSMKERVKAAGGRIEGDLCCRLAWDYTDDLDFHMFEPDNREHIYYSNLRAYSRNGGILDTDANGMDGFREKPVENIVYPDKSKMKEGIYVLKVHNYNRRNTDKSGFSVEIEFAGETYTLDYPNVVKGGEWVTVAEINYSKSKGFSIVKSLNKTNSVKSTEIWGVQTNTFQKVRFITKSPNFFLNEEEKGNKHIFFILEGVKSPEPVRGFFNEYLTPELQKHRKVFEVLGNSLKVKQEEEQLAGIGFSVTQKADFIVKVSGSFTRTLKVIV